MSTTQITPSRVWSPEQDAIFAFIEDETKSLIVQAGAGAGKTTTAVEAARRTPFDESVLFLAFNKRIQEELTNRLPARIRARTFHSLGNAAWKAKRGEWTKLDSYKMSNLYREKIDNENKDFRADLLKLVSLAKGNGLVPNSPSLEKLHPLVSDSDDAWRDIISEFDLEFGHARETYVLDSARKLLIESILRSDEVIDFDDQLYLPVVFRAPFSRFDTVFIDEAQDTNEIQREIVRRSLERGGRIVAIGDPNQAIYGFRGAGTNSMEEMKEEFQAKELTLSTTYRCPISVVKVANEYVSWLRPYADAKEGKVRHAFQIDPKEFHAGDVVLCRNNAPLVQKAFELISAEVRCKVLGRDIGLGLVALVKKMKAENVPDLERRLQAHLQAEKTKYMREGKPGKIRSLADRVETIFVFTRRYPRVIITELQEKISAMFADETTQDKVILSTIHKAKGLEWKRVYLLRFDLIDVEGDPQERNLAYVAVTRAQEELIFLEGEI